MRIDTYCHVGLPRFGTAQDASAVWDQVGIAKGVLVLGPEVPDYGELLTALARYGDRIRGIGIPFGETPRQLCEVVDLQLRAGVMGIRVQPNEAFVAPTMLDLIGERGRWVYAIGADSSPEWMRTLLRFLTRYSQARVGAPHFLRPRSLLDGTEDDGLRCDLLSHPRFYPIFSRHGGVGSAIPYPHKDIAVWVRQVADLTGWDRVLWGSEYPVLYWRDETISSCLEWLPALDETIDDVQLSAFLGSNAQRVIFDQPSPPRGTASMPEWVEDQFDRDRTVPLFASTGLDVPMEAYARLHHRFVGALKERPTLTFSEFVIEQLRA